VRFARRARRVSGSPFIGLLLLIIVTLPYRKFVHFIDRPVAIPRHAHHRFASPIAEGGNL
jgi:hypothetical protein